MMASSSFVKSIPLYWLPPLASIFCVLRDDINNRVQHLLERHVAAVKLDSALHLHAVKQQHAIRSALLAR
jgi:hypothetical protein